MKTSQITENLPVTKEGSVPRNQDKETLQCAHARRICFGDRNYCLKCGVMKVYIHKINRMPTRAINFSLEYSLTLYASDNPSNHNQEDYQAIIHISK